MTTITLTSGFMLNLTDRDFVELKAILTSAQLPAGMKEIPPHEIIVTEEPDKPTLKNLARTFDVDPM